MTIGFTAIPVPQGSTWTDLPGTRKLPLPARLVAAIDRAGGALVRTVYAVTDGGRTAFGLGLHRAHTAQEKLTGLVGDHDLIGELLTRAGEYAQQAGALVVKAELDPHDTDTIAAALDGGFRQLRTPTQPGPIPAGWDATPVGFIHRGHRSPSRELGYYRQTTDITCGPVALLTALHGFGLHPAPTRGDELRTWRASTLIPDTDAYGLALIARQHGADALVVANRTGPLVLDPTLAGWELDLREDLHAELADQARQAGIGQIEQFGVEDVRALVASGSIVVLLIDELTMHAVPAAHWVTVHGLLDDALLIDDPWTDADLGESWIDAHELPIRDKDLAGMAGWDRYQAMIAVEPTQHGVRRATARSV